MALPVTFSNLAPDLQIRSNRNRLETIRTFRKSSPAPSQKNSALTLQRFNFLTGLAARLGRTPNLLPSLFRFYSQRELTGQGIEDFRVPERPGIINRHSLEAPLVAIAHQVAIVAIHQ